MLHDVGQMKLLIWSREIRSFASLWQYIINQPRELRFWREISASRQTSINSRTFRPYCFFNPFVSFWFVFVPCFCCFLCLSFYLSYFIYLFLFYSFIHSSFLPSFLSFIQSFHSSFLCFSNFISLAFTPERIETTKSPPTNQSTNIIIFYFFSCLIGI